jgi:site-specific DNA recombinase
MSRKANSTTTSSVPGVRCAIYTRKSTEEGLEQEFNSLDAQRESAEAYIKSQQHEGWTCLPDRYDDGGFTGGNMERPALRRLMTDIEEGRIDCVVVYKVDRLSRSLLDFAQLMGKFDKHQIAFVSVTQQFNTTNSMGRLMLNVLLSFAQFEREIISERTRDKIAATRRKGKWCGGLPPLGYDVVDTKLVLNQTEAEQVRAIFDLYVQHEGLIGVVHKLDARGWRTKQWTTKKGTTKGGRPYDKNVLYGMLRNVTYLGKLKYKSEVHEGEHDSVISQDVWNRVQSLLQRNGSNGGALIRNRFGAILKGLLYCKSCDCSMSPTHATKQNKRYRYYVCNNATKRGWHKRRDLPKRRADSSLPARNHLGQLISDLLLMEQGRGQDCTVEHFSRSDGTDYFFAYPDDFVQNVTAHDEDGVLTPRTFRQTFVIVFAFNGDEGTLELFARVAPKLKAKIENLFARAILGTDLGNC